MGQALAISSRIEAIDVVDMGMALFAGRGPASPIIAAMAAMCTPSPYG